MQQHGGNLVLDDRGDHTRFVASLPASSASP
jgi:hypothetical protein